MRCGRSLYLKTYVSRPTAQVSYLRTAYPCYLWGTEHQRSQPYFDLLDSNDLSKQIGDDAINKKCNDSISSCSVMSV